MLEITNLNNGMILSTLSISSHGFAFDFFLRPHINGDVLLTYKPMINPLISRCRTPLPTILNRIFYPVLTRFSKVSILS